MTETPALSGLEFSAAPSPPLQRGLAKAEPLCCGQQTAGIGWVHLRLRVSRTRQTEFLASGRAQPLVLTSPPGVRQDSQGAEAGAKVPAQEEKREARSVETQPARFGGGEKSSLTRGRLVGRDIYFVIFCLFVFCSSGILCSFFLFLFVPDREDKLHRGEHTTTLPWSPCPPPDQSWKPIPKRVRSQNKSASTLWG